MNHAHVTTRRDDVTTSRRTQLGPIRALCVAALAVVGGCASNPPPPSHPSRLLSNVAPSFASTTVAGYALDTNQSKGHALVVTFFAPDCAPCERTLVAAQATYAQRHDIVVVGVIDGGDAATATRLVDRYALRFPVVVDQGRSIAKRFDVNQRPMTFVANDLGRVTWVGGSDLTQDGLTSAVNQASDAVARFSR
jgi:cytochrome c biogenesis protein CcmG/thiol:disulfide interchange protein DsbE